MNSHSKDIARKILAYIHEEPSCSRRDIAEALDHAISEEIVQNYLDWLMALGVLIHMDIRSKGYWVVMDKL